MSTREIPIDGPSESSAKGAETVAAGAEQTEQQEAATPEQRIAELEEEVERMRDKALRAVADLENFRRRSMTEREQVVMYGNERLLRSLLPIFDDVQRSVESGEQARDFDGFFQGVSMINGKIRKLLEELGVKRMEVVGRPFDVNLHEALMRQPSDEPEDTVISELEAGYMFGERVLRHAKVIVSAGN